MDTVHLPANHHTVSALARAEANRQFKFSVGFLVIFVIGALVLIAMSSIGDRDDGFGYGVTVASNRN